MDTSKYITHEEMERRLTARFGEPTDEEKAIVSEWLEHERIDIELSATLANVRNSSGMTQQALSDKTGIPQSEISRMMRHGANPKFKTLCKIVAAMGGKVEITWPEQRG